MASNPMQRKVRNAFLGGFLIAAIIAALVVIFLYMQLSKNNNTKKDEIVTTQVGAYVVQTEVASGGVLKNNFQYQTVDSNYVPSNAATQNDLLKYVIKPKEADSEEAEDIFVTEQNISMYLSEEAISKIKLEPGTVLTTDMIGYKDGAFIYEENGDVKVNSGMRLEEYNMIALPSRLQPGDYIDIRLQLPTGETFIVVSKKYVEDANENTVWIKVSEEEILTINNAIVEAYTMTGSKLYANIYVEAGYQGKADVTYVPSAAVLQLIDGDSNIISTAKQYLTERYTGSMRAERNDVIDYNLRLYEDDRLKNTEDGISQEIENLQNARQKYLDELSAY